MIKTITMITGSLTKYTIDICDITSINIREIKGKDAITICTVDAEFNIFKENEDDDLNKILNELKNFCTSPVDTNVFVNNDYLIWIGKR